MGRKSFKYKLGELQIVGDAPNYIGSWATKYDRAKMVEVVSGWVHINGVCFREGEQVRLSGWQIRKMKKEGKQI